MPSWDLWFPHLPATARVDMGHQIDCDFVRKTPLRSEPGPVGNGEIGLMRVFRFFFVLLAMGWAGVSAMAVGPAADLPHVHVQLVSPQGSLDIGKPADIGLYFRLEPGWHVYWKNSGDAGEPPRVRWMMPSGITAGGVQVSAP